MVVAIIGLLVGLIFPAVQSARESARRAQCANNIRQLALAVRQYEHASESLPPGALCVPGAGIGWTVGYGMSWLYWLLPHVEQVPLFGKIDPLCSSSGDLDYSACNRTVLDNVTLPIIQCPSSQMDKVSFLGTSKVRVALLNYAGIAGADGQDPKARYYGVGNNVHATNGLLYAHSKVTSGAVRDGMSNTMLFGEQSDFALTAAGETLDCRSGGPHGAWLGTVKQNATNVLGDPWSNRVFNTTTIGRPLGTRTCDYQSNYTPPHWVGRVTNMDNRSPIISAHPGGAHVAMGDASVQFLAEGIAFDIFQRLAIRDSGQVKSW